jgi:hypothetical protein
MQITAATAPKAVILQFYGNHGSPCILSEGTTMAGTLSSYRATLAAAITHLRAVGTRFITLQRGPVGGPRTLAGFPWETQLVAMYRSLIASIKDPSVVYNDAADNSVELGGAYAPYLTCQPIEILYAACSNLTVSGVHGLNAVRSSDQLHFCSPNAENGTSEPWLCPTWSSGSWRFTQAEAAPIWRWLPSTRDWAPLPVVSSVTPHHGLLTGGTVVTVYGIGFHGSVAAYFVKFYASKGGSWLYGSTPQEVMVPAKIVRVVTDREMQIAAPALNALSPPDVGAVYVRVATPTGWSVSSLAPQRFDEP